MEATFGSARHPTPTRRRARIAAAAGAVVAVVLTGACREPTTPPTSAPATPSADAGGEVGATAATDTIRRGAAASTSTTAAPTTSTSSPTVSSPASPTVSPAPTVPSTSSLVVSPANAAFCDGFRTGVAELTSVSLLDERDPAQVTLALQRIKAFFAGLVPVAPPEISADWQALNQAIQGVDSLEQLNRAGFDTASDAADRIEAWSKANCGFDPSNPI